MTISDKIEIILGIYVWFKFSVDTILSDWFSFWVYPGPFIGVLAYFVFHFVWNFIVWI